MMDLSGEVHDILTTIKLLVKESDESIGSRKSQTLLNFRIGINSDELIDVGKINFCDDETWLYESPIKNSDVKDLKTWLYQDSFALKDIDFHTKRLSLIREITQMDSKKSIDSRTFTRPKKRISRPSIELYNEGYFKMDKSNTSDNNKYIDSMINNTSMQLNETAVENVDESCYNQVPDQIPQNDQEVQQPVVNFDFTQPTTSSIFEKIAARAPDVDSFQNMSPPSLVNSMCSSTFANLMENSYIKNDPTLREIRDADLTEAMLQDYDPPIFKSFTDSCSSISSDTPESFLKKGADTTFSKRFKKNTSNDKENLLNDTYTADNTVLLNSTFLRDSSSEVNSGPIAQLTTVPQHQTKLTGPDPIIPKNNTSSILNGTYRKGARFNDTFKKSPHYQSNELLNDDLNRTITIIDNNVDSNRLNATKRHSYIVDNRISDANQTTNLKRNSVGYSAGSSDSLDYMSSLSNSSKGSNKMLNMAEVDAIVLQQEQSLQQVMSTPKPSSKIISKLWENNCISPIVPLDRGDHLSDSEASSNEDYLTVGSSPSLMTPFGSDTHVFKSNKSLETFKSHTDIPKVNPRSLNALPTKTKKFDNNYRGSYTNLKTVGNNLKGSYTNLRTTGANVKGSYSNLLLTGNNMKGSYTNLKTMSNNLKGSYTQLKPVLTNLPCADTNLKVFNSNATTTITRQPINSRLSKGSDGNLKIAEVAPTLRDIAPKAQVKSAPALNCAIKPQSKASGLPRPISAIPRPMGSRIPGPQTFRPATRQLNRPKKMSQAGSSSYESFEDDEGTNNHVTKEKSKSKCFNELQKTVQELLSDSGSTTSTESLSEDVNEENEDTTESDPDMKLILSALEKSADNSGLKRQNKTFSEQKIRDIERINSILMKKILSHNRRANRFSPAPKNKKVTSAALNRKKQQRQIDHDNLILLRKIQTVKPVVSHSKH